MPAIYLDLWSKKSIIAKYNRTQHAFLFLFFCIYIVNVWHHFNATSENWYIQSVSVCKQWQCVDCTNCCSCCSYFCYFYLPKPRKNPTFHDWRHRLRSLQKLVRGFLFWWWQNGYDEFHLTSFHTDISMYQCLNISISFFRHFLTRHNIVIIVAVSSWVG